MGWIRKKEGEGRQEGRMRENSSHKGLLKAATIEGRCIWRKGEHLDQSLNQVSSLCWLKWPRE